MNTTKKTFIETSPDARLLYARLSKMDVNEMITYAELSAVIGRDVQREGRGSLTTARRMAQRDDDIITECVISEGVKRLDDDAIASIGQHTVHGIRRASKRGAERMLKIRDYTGLSDDKKRDYTVSLSALGLVRHMLAPKRIEAATRTVSDSSNGLPTAETLKLLG